MTGTHHTLARALSLTLACAAHLGLAAPMLAQDDAGRAFRTATGLLNKGMHELAAEEYRAFLESHADDPKASTARYALGVCLSRMGKHAEACDELARVVGVAGFEFAADAGLLLGQSQLLADRPGDAARTLGAYLKDHGAHAQADLGASLLGEALMRDGKPDEAARAFASLAKRWPESPARQRADLLWAMCDAGAGRDKEAAQRLADLRKKFPASETAEQATLLEAQCRHRLGDTTAALKLYKSIPAGAEPSVRYGATLGVAQLTRAAGNSVEAAKLLESLLADAGSTGVAASARVELARCRLDADEPERALAELAAMGKGTPAPLADDAAYWAARAESKLGRHAAAAKRLEACETRFPRSELLAEMMYERADALAKAGEAAEADGALVALRERFPDHPLAADAALARATAAFQANDDATAKRLSEAFVRQHPEHAQAATASLLIAECAYRADDFAAAEASYAAFLSRYPKDRNAWHARVRRGLCLVRLGKVSEGAAVLQTSLRETDTGDPALRRAATVALADAAFAAGDWKSAELWFAPLCVDGTPPAVMQDALLKLGLAVHRQGRTEDALESYDRLLGAFPDGVHAGQATFERGQALMELGRDADAAACFTSVIGREAKTSEPRFTAYSTRHLAALAMRAGRAAEAASLLAQLTPDADDAPQLSLDQGLALLAAGRFAEAEQALRSAASDSSSSRIATEAGAQLGIAMARQSRLDEALAALDRSLAKEEKPGAATLESVRYERAAVLRRLGRDDEALQAYEAFLAAAPAPRLGAYAHLDIAQLHAKAGRHAESLRAADAALESADDPATFAALRDHATYLRGVAQHNLGDHAKAVETLAPLAERAKGSPVGPAAALVRGEALLKLNRAAEAARSFELITGESEPADVAGPALLRLGEARATAREWTPSEQAFTAFLSRFPDSPLWFQARFGIGWAAENQGRHEAAIAAYRMVTAKHDGPTAARAQFQIGECFFALKKHDEAVKELLRVDILYAYPEWSAAALYEAGRCLAEQGKAGDARQQFTQVTTRFADTRWAALAKEELQRTAPAAPAPLPGRSATPTTPPATPRKERTR